MLRHSRGLPGLRASLQHILACCGLALLFSASPSFAQSSASLKNTTQATSSTQAASAASTTQQTQFEGELEVMHWDNRDHTSITKHFLRTSDGKRYELKFKGHAPSNLQGGAKVRMKGSLSGNLIYLSTSTSTSIQTVLAAPSNSTGVQKTAVILVNFQDNSAQPINSAAAQNLVFSTVNNFYQENSFQQTSFSGNVYGWYTIPMSGSSTTCDTTSIKSYARAAALAAGVDLSSYSRFVYMFPEIKACGFAGAAIVGGTQTDAWINGYFDLHTVGHELGHNLGLIHSHSMNCDLTPIGNTCSGYDYGDVQDIMGASDGHVNAYAKESLGWLNASGQPPITTVQTSGSYVISPYETKDFGVKALKILRSTDPTTGEKTWYYLEYRQVLGFDSALANVGYQVGGVSIRSASASRGSYLMDMTPNSNTIAPSVDQLDGALVVGKSFTDANAGVTITVTWANATGAGVDVVFNSSNCTHSAPSVVVSPASSQAVAPGTAVNYTVAVTNADVSSCGSSTFNLAAVLPTGWSGALGPQSLSIAAGSVSSTTLTVTSPSTAIAGSYSIAVKATNSASTSYNGSGSATYSVATTTTTTGKGKKR